VDVDWIAWVREVSGLMAQALLSFRHRIIQYSQWSRLGRQA
jgi:hypothetical protein